MLFKNVLLKLKKKLILVHKFLNFTFFDFNKQQTKRDDGNLWDGNFLIKNKFTFTCITEVFTLNVDVLMHSVAVHSTIKCENDIENKCCKNFLYKNFRK